MRNQIAMRSPIESKDNSKWLMQSVTNLGFASPDTNSSSDTRHDGNMEIEEMDCAIIEREDWACRGSCWACSVEQPRRTMGRLPWPPQGNKHWSRWWIWTMFLTPYAQWVSHSLLLPHLWKEKKKIHYYILVSDCFILIALRWVEIFCVNHVSWFLVPGVFRLYLSL